MTVLRVGTATAPEGAELHWRAQGEGKVALLASNGIGVSTFFWRHLGQYFSGTHTFVTWDYRGHGKSPVPQSPEDLTVALCARIPSTCPELSSSAPTSSTRSPPAR